MEQKNILTSSGGQNILDETKVDNSLVIFTYTLKEFLYWWYVRMLYWHLRMLGRISIIIDDNFSISLLIKNFFLPWHRDFSLIGWTFGILIKLIYLPIAIVTYILLISIYIVVILLWLLLPAATLVFIIRSIINI